MDVFPASTSECQFSSLSVGLQVQKKVLGKVASRNVVKHFLSDATTRLLDNLYRLLKDFYNKKDAEKVVKNIIKMSVKVGVLTRHDQLNSEDDRAQCDRFQRTFRRLIMTVVSFHRVDFSYDKHFLNRLISEAQTSLICLIRPHLTDKSAERVRTVFDYLGRDTFLDAIFRPRSKYTDYMGKICDDLDKIIEDK